MATLIQYGGTGRRKSSVARVYLTPNKQAGKKGTFTVNGREFGSYFPSPALRADIEQPLQIISEKKQINLYDRFNINVNVKGGGISGQAGAVRLGITRALLANNPELREFLKPAGLITRDPRSVERKKAGLKKARKASQFSKR